MVVNSIVASKQGNIHAQWLLLVPIALFAWSRVPYDDEWFSLTLARDTTWPQFWASLAHDVHPPYVALADRLVMGLGGVAAVTALHLAATSAGLLLLCRAGVRLGLSQWAVWLAAFHPVLFFYAGAARWYPFAFLADALRRWALADAVSQPCLSKRSALAFAGGVGLGALAGFAQLLVITLDAVVWLALWYRRKRVASALRLLALSIIVPGLSILAWSPAWRLLLHSVRAGGHSPAAGSLATLLLGLIGEAQFFPPWTLLAALSVPGLVVVAVRAFRDPSRRVFALGLLFSGLGWGAAIPLGVWHPRYALVLWWAEAALVLDTLVQIYNDRARVRAWSKRVADGLVLVTATWLAIGLCLTIGQRNFVKADLNLLSSEVCGPLASADLIVAPYPRLQPLLSKACPSSKPIVTMGSRRHFGREQAQRPVVEALFGAASVHLLEVRVDGSSIATAQREARALLDARCRRESEQLLDDDPFARWKRTRGPSGQASAARLLLIQYDCKSTGP